MLDENDIVSAAREGSHDAFASLVGLHHARVRGYLARWVRDAATVDDLAQEVFMAAWRNLPSFREEVPFGAWLAGIARNQALASLRAHRRRLSRDADMLAEAIAGWRIDALEADADRLSDRLQESEALGICLGALSETQRELIEEHYFAQRSCAEIAVARDQGHGAVRMALMRVRQALRACLERRLGAQAAT